MMLYTGKEKIKQLVFGAKTLHFAPFLLMAIPVLLYFWYIHTYGINVFFWDEWEIVLRLDKYHSGTLGFSDLLAQHNEHRAFFPRIVYLFIGNLTGLNNVSNMYFSALLLLFTLVIIFIAWIRYSGLNERSIWGFVPVPYILFSLLQYENTLEGVQICVYMVLLFSVLSFVLLETDLIIPAVISAIVASFSAIQGLLVWPVGALYFFINWKFETKSYLRKNASIWVISGLAVWYLYFADYQKPASHPSMGFAIFHPLDGAAYFLSIISDPVVPTSRFMGYYWAILFGSVIIILYCIFIQKILCFKNIRRFYLPLSLMFFSLLFDIVTTFGRSGFGVEQAFSPRYTTYNLAGMIGLYLSMLVIINYKKMTSKSEKFVVFIVIGVILLNIIVSIPVGLTMGEDLKTQRTEAKDILLNISNASDSAIEKYIYPDASQLRNFAEILKKYRTSSNG